MGLSTSEIKNAAMNELPLFSVIADAHRGDGKRFVVRADEKLTAFLELEAAVRICIELACQAGKIFWCLDDQNR